METRDSWFRCGQRSSWFHIRKGICLLAFERRTLVHGFKIYIPCRSLAPSYFQPSTAKCSKKLYIWNVHFIENESLEGQNFMFYQRVYVHAYSFTCLDANIRNTYRCINSIFRPIRSFEFLIECDWQQCTQRLRCTTFETPLNYYQSARRFIP